MDLMDLDLDLDPIHPSLTLVIAIYIIIIIYIVVIIYTVYTVYTVCIFYCKFVVKRAVCRNLLADTANLLQNMRFARIAKDHIQPPRSYSLWQFATTSLKKYFLI